MKHLLNTWFRPGAFLVGIPETIGRALSLFALLLITLQAAAQDNAVQVTGRVVDAGSREPLPGVMVVLQGSTVGTSTDLDGNYTLSLPNGTGTLAFSYIGYESKQVPVAGQNTINVELGVDTKALEEIVVVGYGTQRKSDVTGAVASIQGEALREVPGVANAVQALQGRVAGVDISRTGTRPGAGGQIRIRGNRSLNAGNDPLIVLDGIPYGGSINDLNVDDIAKIDVLKDASATAIYGSRGANGVIIITTKRGEVGPPRISYNAFVGATTPVGKYNLFNAEEFKAFRDYAQYSAGYSLPELEGIANGVDTDWQDVAFQTGMVTNHELALSGGTENTTYGFSGGYFKEEGVLPHQAFERFSLRSTIDARINKRIKVGLNSLNTLGYTNGEGINPMYAIARISPFTPVYNADGTPNLYPLAGTVDETATMNPLTLSDRENIVDQRRRFRTFNSLYGELQIVEGLKYRLNVGLDFRHDTRGTYNGPGTIVNPAATTTEQANGSIANGEAWSVVLENLLTYEKTIAEMHRFSFTGLYSVQQDQGFNTTLNGNNFPASGIQYYNFNLANNVLVPNDGNNFTRNGLMSFMGRVNYAFGDRYLLTATFRSDGSSVFPENQFLNYPAFALGWNIANEQFMQGVPAITTLKLRAGYGVTGNQGIPANATRGSLASNRYNYADDNVLGYFVGSLPNQELRWESTEQTNIGLDFGFFNNRITGSLEVYQQNTENLLVNKQLPRSNGANSYWENAAATQNKGIEFNVSTVNVETPGGFSWTSDYNFSLNREEILRLEEPGRTQNVGNGWFVGNPVNVIYDFTKVGIWQTEDAALAATYGRTPGEIRLADISGPEGVPDGQITDLDRSVIGTFQPDWVGGMTQRIAYKGFDLSTVVFARMGASLVAPYLSTDGGGTAGYFGFNSARPNQHKVDYWTPNNPTNAFPKPVQATNLPYSSTLAYYDASFIRVRSINLGYNIPTGLVERAGMSSFRIYASVQNPLLLYSPFVSSGLGIDPEGTGTGGAVQSQGSTGGVTSQAITVGLTTPATRQFIIGINARF